MNLRKYLLPAALILALSGGFAVTQNINKALQLSQDATGAFGVDTSNSVYFPLHINGNSLATPTISTAAGTAATVVGTDLAGRVTGGAASTTAVTLTFSSVFVNTPSCTVTSQNMATSPLGFVPTISQLAISSMGAAIVNYQCIGIRG